MKKGSIVLSLIIYLAAASCSGGPRISYVTAATTPQPASGIPSSTTTTTPAPAVVHVSPAAYQQQYSQSAATLNFLVTQGNWQFTLVAAGFFSASISGSTITYLRVDMQITAVGIGGGYLQPGNIAVSSPQAQYLLDTGDSTLNLTNYSFSANTSVTGYWIFQIQGGLDPLNTARLSFAAGYDSSLNSYQWIFQL